MLVASSASAFKRRVGGLKKWINKNYILKKNSSHVKSQNATYSNAPLRINEQNNSEEVGTSHLLLRRQDGTSVLKLCNSPLVWDYIHFALWGETGDQDTSKIKVWVANWTLACLVKVQFNQKKERKEKKARRMDGWMDGH